jgi:hypothetical protein
MADTKASNETAAATLDGTEIVRIVQSGSTVRTTAQALRDQVGTFRGALVLKAADQTTANYTAGALVAWDEESYDVGGWHDNVTNNTRLTVPAGVTRVRLNLSLLITAISGDVFVQVLLYKNGAIVDGGGSLLADAAGLAYRGGLTSAVLAVTAGDYFEVHLTVETDTSVTVAEAGSHFAIEKIY